jgi:hypothetical protein|tara:strand:- start:2959 stop:4515 length:1557 start_codon:yes stop_codon:yes gene_type:complete
MDTNLVKRFAILFRGLDKAYGTVDITGQEASGKRKGKYTFVREKRTSQTFVQHLNGETSVGIVPINEENMCWWGAIDIDTYPLDHASIVKRVSDLKLPIIVCRSKSGGGHLYLFLKEKVSAKTLQIKLREIASELGCAEGTEIFPKQIQLVLERGDLGNFLNLPYFNCEGGGLRYGIKMDGSAASLEEFLDASEAAAITPKQLDNLSFEVAKPDIDQRLKDGPPCLQALFRQGFPEGTRNNGLFNVGVYLRKAFPDDWETKILEYNQNVMIPPLDLKEVNIVAEQLKKKEYQYRCSDQPISGHCNKDLCRSRKHGVGGGQNTPTISSLRKYDSEPPLWFLDVNGAPVELDTEALQKQPRFQILCMEQINFMPRTMARVAWEAQMNTLLGQMVATEGAVISTSDDTSIRGVFYDLVEEFTTHMQVAEDREEILLRKPWLNEETGRVFFRLKDLEAFLKRNKFLEYRSNKIAQRLRDIEGTPEVLRIKNRHVRCWAIPASEPIEDSFSSNFTQTDDDIPF